MSEVDWSKAPEGSEFARLCGTGAVDFYKKVSHRLAYWSSLDGEWVLCERAPDDPELIARPSEAGWSGEGLPPAGAVCEVKWINGPIGDGSWGVAEILYSSNRASGAIVWRWKGVPSFEFGANAGDVKLRPLRTPEQIAAEEREKAIHAMVRLMGEAARQLENPHAMKSDLAGAYARALYDAGYRKAEGGAA